ncbi:MAG TPA: sterol desaturase family protein [Chryseosolibacter sp.]
MKTKQSIRLFSSPWLERLTRTHSLVPVSLFLLYAGALLFASVQYAGVPILTSVSLILLGVLVFTWAEYQIHRRIFHLKPSTPKRAKLQYTIHGVHHELPEDKSRLAMPPVLSLAIATGLVFLFKWIAGSFSLAFLAGFFTGYAGYLFVHYLVHAYRAPKNRFKILWRHHHIHHYKDDTCAFGVSSPLWDYIYNTMPKK